MDNFKLYSEYYNLFYKDKDYAGEADYVEKLFLGLNPNSKTVLDFGCGSGRHAYELYKKGYMVTGVDLSESMLKLTKDLPVNNIEFLKGDVRKIQLNREFDVVISLFHVLSYQTKNEDIVAFFNTVKEHLEPNGVFICDAWYGPGVLNDKPAVRKKELENLEIKITRIAEPEIHFDKNIVDVNYSLLILDKRLKNISEINEKHIMRYFFNPEINFYANCTGLKLINSYKWMTSNGLKENPWNIVYIFINNGN